MEQPDPADAVPQPSPLEILQLPDAIMESDVTTHFYRCLREKDVQPKNIVRTLAQSYEGIAEMTNVATEWLDLLDDDIQDGNDDEHIPESQRLLEQALKEMLIQKWDPVTLDAKFMANNTEPDFLLSLIEVPFWRQTIYELAEQHQKCLLLNYAIQRIADAGYQREIAVTSAGCTYVSVFNDFLVDSFLQFQDKEKNEEERITGLINACGQFEHTYLYAQAVLNRLIQEKNGFILKPVAKSLEAGVFERYNKPLLVGTLRLLLSGAQGDFASAIVHVLRERTLAPGDLITMYKTYDSPNPPSVELLRDTDIIDILISEVFIPSTKGNAHKNAHKDKYFWLAAYAACAVQGPGEQMTSSVDQDLLQSSKQALNDLDLILTKAHGTFGPGRPDPLAAKGVELVQILECSVASMAFLTWATYMFSQTSYLESFFHPRRVPAVMFLFDEIAHLHPLQREILFEILIKVLDKRFAMNLPNDTTLALRKTITTRLLYLMQLGFTIPVINFFASYKRELTIHWLERVLDLIQPPYAAEFVQALLAAIIRLGERGDFQGQNVIKTKLRTFCNSEPVQGDDTEAWSALLKRAKLLIAK